MPVRMYLVFHSLCEDMLPHLLSRYAVETDALCFQLAAAIVPPMSHCLRDVRGEMAVKSPNKGRIIVHENRTAHQLTGMENDISKSYHVFWGIIKELMWAGHDV